MKKIPRQVELDKLQESMEINDALGSSDNDDMVDINMLQNLSNDDFDDVQREEDEQEVLEWRLIDSEMPALPMYGKASDEQN